MNMGFYGWPRALPAIRLEMPDLEKFSMKL